jgi:YVTN family beta-propeller protein
LPARTDKLLIVLSPKDATAKVFLAIADRLDLLRAIPTGKGPQDVCIAPDGNTAYVANGLDDSITGTLAPAHLKSPTSVAITPDGKKLYLGARGSNLLLVLSPAGQVLKEIALTDPATVAIAPAAPRAYVASNSTQSVLVVDTVTDEIVATIKTGRQPKGIAFTPDGKTVVITCVAHDVMHLVDAATNEVKATIGAGRSLQSAAVLPDGGWPSPSRAMCAMQASIPTCRWLTCAAPARAKSRTFPLARWPIRSWSAVTALICM